MFGLNDNNDDHQDHHQDDGVVGVPDVTKPAGNSDSTNNTGFMSSAAPATVSQPDSTNTRDTQDKDNDLLDIKQKALAQLQPLVDHLDQTPEEKFKTTMMMIQASDNKSLLPAAYQAAQSISDEKARAEALLGIINEINYFTTKP